MGNRDIKVRNENYITVLGWMRNIPEIENNNELLVYALIYGFSQSEGQYLTCKQSYIAQWIGINRYNCNKLLSRMEKKNLIGKKLIKKYGAIKQYKYYCVLPDSTSAVKTTDECRYDNCECCYDNRASAVVTTVTSAVATHNDNNIYNNILYISESTSPNVNLQTDLLQTNYNFKKLESELLRADSQKGET